MDSSDPNLNDKYDRWLSQESDGFMVEVLRGDDRDDINLATQILLERYGTKIGNFVARKLPPDWVEDVNQIIWTDFYRYVINHEVTTGVSNLLWSFAKKKRADAVDRLVRERIIEDNTVPMDFTDEKEGELINHPIEETFDKQEQLKYLKSIPLIPSFFSDCERIYWLLRYHLDYPTEVIARLLDKNPQNVLSSLSVARKKVKDYFRSEDFALLKAFEQEYSKASIGFNGDFGGSIERFANFITSRFTPDELKPLNLTVKDFRSNYSISVLLPYLSNYELRDQHRLLLLLTSRSQLQRTKSALKNFVEGNSEQLMDFQTAMSNDFLVTVILDGKDIVLTPQYYVHIELIREIPQPTLSTIMSSVRVEPPMSLKRRASYAKMDGSPLLSYNFHSPKIKIPLIKMRGHIDFYDKQEDIDQYLKEIYLDDKPPPFYPISVDYGGPRITDFFPVFGSRPPYVHTFSRGYGRWKL